MFTIKRLNEEKKVMQCCTCITHNPTNYLKQIKVTFVKYYVQCEQHHIMASSITMNIVNINPLHANAYASTKHVYLIQINELCKTQKNTFFE
jgi:hypothetical protein